MKFELGQKIVIETGLYTGIDRLENRKAEVIEINTRGSRNEAIVRLEEQYRDFFNDLSDIIYLQNDKFARLDIDFLPDEITCSECGELHKKEELVQIAFGKFICEDCLVDNFIQCSDCGKWIPIDDEIMTHDGNSICEDCYMEDYHKCTDCGEVFRHSEFEYTRNGIYICHTCADHYIECENCGRLINTYDEDALFHDDETNEDLCESCFDARMERRNRSINDYSYKPNVVLFSRPSEQTSLYYGIELEVDRGNNASESAKMVKNAFDGKLYCKRDGSLDNGYEIVTHPMSFEYHMNEMNWLELCAIPKQNGFKSHDAKTCGLHIHASRAGIGSTDMEKELTIAKLIILIDRFFDNELLKFSRRSLGQLDRWAQKPSIKINKDDSEAAIHQKLYEYKRYGRYYALNLCNAETIEFRLFRGSLKHTTVLATIQFVETLIKYAMAHSVEEVLDVEWRDIINYIGFEELSNYWDEVKDREVDDSDDDDDDDDCHYDYGCDDDM